MSQTDLTTISLRLLREPALREAFDGLGDGRRVAEELAAPLLEARLCRRDGEGYRRTRLGRAVAYQLSEHRIQIEQGAAARFVSRLDVRRDSRVLDVGCGGGQSLAALGRERPRIAVGLELDPTALAVFAAVRQIERMEATFPVRGNAENLPFADRSFDRVLCRVVLMHVRVLPTLAEIARVCDAGGLVYLHLTDFWFYWRKLLRLRWERGGVPFGLVNGLLLQTLGRQIRWRDRRTMSYQTVSGIARRLERLGFEIVAVEETRPASSFSTLQRLQPKILARRLARRSALGAAA